MVNGAVGVIKVIFIYSLTRIGSASADIYAEYSLNIAERREKVRKTGTGSSFALKNIFQANNIEGNGVMGGIIVIGDI